MLSALGVCAAVAGELAPFRDGARLGARVKSLSLPGSFRKDLRSGLTNRLLLRIELVVDARVLETRTVELAVKYDLWDENFRLTLDAGQGMVTESVLTTEQQVLAFVNDVPICLVVRRRSPATGAGSSASRRCPAEPHRAGTHDDDSQVGRLRTARKPPQTVRLPAHLR